MKLTHKRRARHRHSQFPQLELPLTFPCPALKELEVPLAESLSRRYRIRLHLANVYAQAMEERG